MAGVIGAVANNGVGLTGIIENVSILPIRYIDASGQMLLPDLFKALRYAVEMKADVILLHTPTYIFGASAENPQQAKEMANLERQMLRKSLADIAKIGTPLVVSAGNSGDVIEAKNNLVAELVNYTNITVVTSVDQKDTRPFIANYGRERVHTSAPGKDVLTTLPGNRYENVTSTSLAAAHVAGAVALALDKQYGRVEPRKLVEALIKPEASDALDNLRYETIGGNRLNLTKYLNYFDK
jgi:subtilisin family serine protease